MERNSSHGTSWADQWDYKDPETLPAEKKETASTKYGKKVGEGLGKTKAAASTGFKKVKEGTTLGLHWIKDKYHKTTQKN